MARIMIVGGPGSGKSTLARKMGAALDLPVFHMDLIHWKQNWVERTQAEKLPLVQEVEARAAWILEGGLSATYANRIARADLVVWLDLPVGLRLWRVTKRLFRYLGTGTNRADLPAGCNERLHWETLKFYRFIWTSRWTSRQKIATALAQASGGTELAHLRSRADVVAFEAERLPRRT